MTMPIDVGGAENSPEHTDEDWSLEKAVVAPFHIWSCTDEDNGALGMVGPESSLDEEAVTNDPEKPTEEQKALTDTVWVRLPKSRWPKEWHDLDF